MVGVENLVVKELVLWEKLKGCWGDAILADMCGFSTLGIENVTVCRYIHDEELCATKGVLAWVSV